MFKNLRDPWTTIPTILSMVFAILATVFPHWFTEVSVEEVSGASINWANSTAVIVAWLVGLFSKRG